MGYKNIRRLILWGLISHMYYNEKHKHRVEQRGDGYTYLGSYKSKEITIDGKNKKGNSTYIRIKCPYCGKEYDITLNSFARGNKSKCTYCCNKYENSFAYHIQQELGESLNKYWNWEKNTVNPYCISKCNDKKVWIKCDKINYHNDYGGYPTTCYNFYNGKRCGYCSSHKVHPKDSFAQWGIDTFGDDFLEKYWSKKNDELDINPWEIKPQSNKKVWILCQEKDYHNDKGGYEIMPNDFYNEQRCSYCSSHKIHPKDSFGALYPEKAKYWSKNNKRSPFEVSPKTGDKYWFICEKCSEEFDRSLDNLNKCNTGVVCKKCNSSQGEVKISRWLDKNNINYIHDKPYFSDLLGLGSGLLRPDFILPDEKIWIEYDGEQHDKWQESWMPYEKFKMLQKHDKKKNEYAKEHGWELIRIKEKDFDNIENILEKELKWVLTNKNK